MAKRASSPPKETVIRGSGNVFADLGFSDAGERQTKLRLAYELNELLAERALTQQQAGKLLGLSQPKISSLGHYKLDGFSVERLMMLLTVLDRDIDIVIRRKPKSRTSGKITVVPA